MTAANNNHPSGNTRAQAVFASDDAVEDTGPCAVTILCTMDDERARKRYLELTREIDLPRKQAEPSCLRVTQTVPQNTDAVQVRWIQRWTSAAEFKGFMQRLIEEYPRLSEVNDPLSFNPEVTISTAVR
jgi:hypothetical protein